MPVPQTVEEKNITPRVNGFSYDTVSLILFVSLAATALCVRSRGLKKKKGGYFVIYGLGLLSLLCVGVFHHSMMDDSLQKIISDLPVENSGNYIDNKNSIFYNTIELLFMGNRTLASEYLAKNPFENFKVRSMEHVVFVIIIWNIRLIQKLVLHTRLARWSGFH